MDVSFVDADHGWALVFTCSPTCVATVDGSDDGGASWERLATVSPLAPGGTGQIAFENSSNGFVILTPSPAANSTSRQGVLFVTGDGGRTWRQSRTPGTPQWIGPGQEDWLLSGTCDPNGMCADQLDTSSDGGTTWTERGTFPRLADPSVVRQGSSGWLYAASRPGVSASGLMYSGDDGHRWTKRPWPCSAGGFDADLAATSGGHLWLVCGDEPGAGQQLKSVFRSLDAGQDWQLEASNGDRSTPHAGTISSGGYVGGGMLAAASDQHAWLGLDRWTLLATSDGGVSWSPEASFPPPEDFFSGLQSLNDRTGWAAVTITTDNPENGIYRTTDGGGTWSHASLP